MKRFSFFVAQLLLGSIAMWAQTPKDGIYTIVCPNDGDGATQRGALAYKTGNDNVVYLSDVTGVSGTYANLSEASHTTLDDVCGYWAVKTYNGKTWFYNLANGKTLAKPTTNNGNSAWGDIAEDNNVTFEYSSASFADQLRIKSNFNNAYISVSPYWGKGAGGGVRWYNQVDDKGCNLSVAAVSDELAAELTEKYASNILSAEEKMGISHDTDVTLNEPIKAIGELSNNYAYTITSYARGQWTAVAGKDEIYQSKGTEGSDWTKASGDYTPIATNNEDQNQQWAILRSKNNNLYLYNVGQKKFFISNANFSSRYAKAALGAEPNSSGFVLTDRSSAVSSQGFYTGSEEAVRWGVGMNVNDADYFFGVTNWNGQQWNVFQNNTDYAKNSDGGMYFKVVPVATFDPAEAMAKIEAFETVPVEPETYEYKVYSGGMPTGVVITIKDEVIEPDGAAWTEGATYTTTTTLSAGDIKVSGCGDGNVYDISLDNDNYQININFTQIFQPASSTSDVDASYYIKNGKGYVHLVNGNLLPTQNRKEADKFIFIPGETKGEYYIYDVNGGKYVYATGTGDGTPHTTQAGSKVQLTDNQSVATCWTFDNQICITPAAGGGSGWNFCGGAATNVIDLWKNTDGNSKWEILDSNVGSLACAVTMFSEPGKAYMHKLVPEANVSVTGIELLEGLEGSDFQLKADRENVGNGYKYIVGHAPEAEGTYYYNVLLSDGTKAKVSLTVSSFLQSPTPGMVWVSWNWFQDKINATNLTETAEGLKAKGLLEAGYDTIVIDDAWGTGSSPANLTYNTSKFPDMKSFVAGVNNLGVKVGIYSDAAGSTCGGYQPGSINVEAQHVAMFDSWGIDFLKYDFCGGNNAFKSYKAMGDAIAELNAQRKGQPGATPFVFNACEWGSNAPWTWGAEAGTSMWRATQDAREDWVGTHQFPGVLAGTDEVRDLWMYAGVNRFNDLDMMCIGLHGKGGPSNHIDGHGNGGQLSEWLSGEKARTQMSLWSMFASPLSLSCDVRLNPSNPNNAGAGYDPLEGEDLEILTNKDIIAISQDPLGQQAEYLPLLGSNGPDRATSGQDVYVKDLANGDIALAIVNRSASATADSKTIKFADIYLSAGTKYYVKDIWGNTITELTDQLVTGEFKPAETKVYRISASEFPGTEAPSLDEAKAAYDEAHTNAWGLLDEYRENEKVQELLYEYSEKLLDIENELSTKQTENGELTVDDYTTATSALVNAMNTAREAIETLLAPVDPESLIPSVTGYKMLAPISAASELKSGKYFLSVSCKNQEGLLYGNASKSISAETANFEKEFEDAYVWTVNFNEDGTFTLTNSQGQTLSVQGRDGEGRGNLLYTNEASTTYDAANFSFNDETVDIAGVNHWMLHQQNVMSRKDGAGIAYLHCNGNGLGLESDKLHLSYWENCNPVVNSTETSDKIAFYPAKAIYDREAYVGTIVVLVDMAKDGEADIEQIERVVDIILEK